MVDNRSYFVHVLKEYKTSLWDFQKQKGNFSINCAAMIGSKMSLHLKRIHGMGFVHLDVKPDNMLIEDITEQTVFIDFGNAQYYLKEDNKTHRKQREELDVKGSRYFMSLNGLKFRTQSRKDDLISLLYSLFYVIDPEVFCGILRDPNNKKFDKISKFRVDKAKPFIPILEYIYGLEYDQEPDHDKISFMFKKVILE